MKVGGPSGPSAVGGARPASSPAAAGGFQPIVSAAASGAAGVSRAGGVSAINSLDALIALQEVGGPLERRRRATGRASRILDALDELKIELLAGGLTPTVVEALARAVRDQRALTDDPRLEGVLDEIETRAAVELAKLESARFAEHGVAT
ncbi:MAG TPA: flagellar assembly protein FliX [Caulobacteraceae bacterium]|nr:flagellar assembly protein FliX [Caulobacteraceae bacterium]